MSKSEKTKKYIIETAATVFNKRGYAGTSLNDLTEATNLTKGSIYGNFTGKDDVAIEAFDYNVKKWIGPIESLAAEKKDAVKKLLAYSEYYRQNHTAIFESGGCPMLNLAAEADDTNDFLAQKANAALNSYDAGLRKIIDKGIKDKELKKVDAKKYAAVLFSLIEGGMLLAKSTGKMHFLTDALDQFDEIAENLKD
jgi:TetR/AcrR family transcriptional regulator, transcriptional repressor for nem operon